MKLSVELQRRGSQIKQWKKKKNNKTLKLDCNWTLGKFDASLCK